MNTTEARSSAGTYYRRAGDGEPVLLLHGWPQTSHCWRDVLSDLSASHDVIAPDLRGLGETPDTGEGYAKLSIARDLALLMSELKVDRFHLVGHDWGGVVAFMLAAHHPERVATLTVVDVVIPSAATPLMSQGGKRWHHPFHQTANLPEALVTGREQEYLGWFFDNFGASSTAISAEDREVYARCYSRPEVLSAGFGYYRAFEQDKADARAASKLVMPVLAVGGDSGWGRGAEVAASLRPLTDGEVAELIIKDAGHWVPEEKPKELAEAVRRHIRTFPLSQVRIIEKPTIH